MLPPEVNSPEDEVENRPPFARMEPDRDTAPPTSIHAAPPPADL